MARYQEECQAHASKDGRAAGRGERQVAERADVFWEGRTKRSRAQEKFQGTADIRAAMTREKTRAGLGRTGWELFWILRPNLSAPRLRADWASV